MAEWAALREALERVDHSVRYTWDELEALVGRLPISATDHRAWWSGDRPHVKAWRQVGFTLYTLIPGREVSFIRDDARSDRTGPPLTGSAHATLGDSNEQPDLVLITCVKQKLDVPAAARDLYVSTLFKKERAYAEKSGAPWFILSAEHGLVAPDDWLAPYERYLPDTPKSFRDAWGAWVAERLELLTGPLHGRVIEVHAGQAYVAALLQPLTSKGAVIAEPLAGLSMGQRLQWYDQAAAGAVSDDSRTSGSPTHPSTEEIRRRLSNRLEAVTPQGLLEKGPDGLRGPGLYSWWVDDDGAAELSLGLGIPMVPGLIYAGLAGATRWPSGRRSTNTLWSRLTGMHLGGRHEFSTFRRSIGSILAAARCEKEIDEAALTTWMHANLTVVAVLFSDADSLGRLEGDVLSELDPPLNLKGMTASPIRQRISALRRPHTRRAD